MFQNFYILLVLFSYYFSIAATREILFWTPQVVKYSSSSYFIYMHNVQIAGVYHWKHGRKGCGVFWLRQARDEVRLSKIAQQLFDSVGKSISDESFKVIKISKSSISIIPS